MTRAFTISGAVLLVAAMLLWRAAAGADLALLLALRAPAGAARAIGLFTDLGGIEAQAPLALAAVALLLWRGERRRALLLVAAIAAGRILVEAAKEAIARPRPPLALHLSSVASLSMPSSHTACTTFTCLLVAGALGATCSVTARAVTAPAVAAALAFAAAIGLSRVALGVHFPSDVLAGWGAGLLWAAAWWRVLADPRRHARRA